MGSIDFAPVPKYIFRLDLNGTEAYVWHIPSNDSEIVGFHFQI